MYSKTERIRSICKSVRKQIESVHSDLQLCFIVHGTGQFSEAVALCEQEIIGHPASEYAQTIITKFMDRNHTSFLGLAMSSQPMFFGLWQKDACMALININVDTYKDVNLARHDIYHMAWHAIDLLEYRKTPENRKKYKSGPMIPKRSTYNMASSNLKADAFAANVCGLQKNKTAIKNISQRRAHDVLRPVIERQAEDYPFIIAMEPTDFAFEDLLEQKLPASKIITEAHRIAQEVALIVNEGGIGIEQWWSFAKPAQDMAWRRQSQEDILGAAVNTSEDPYVRAIGYIIAEVTNIEPSTSHDLMTKYNAFISQERNERLHNELIENIFDNQMENSLRLESGRPMSIAAHELNKEMTDGRIVGWCAGALQASAKAFDKALSLGKPAEQAARLEFESSKSKTKWNDLHHLSEKTIERKRQGYAMTLGHIADLCEQIEGVSQVLQSVSETLQDPDYIAELEQANELNNIPKFTPQGPSAAPAATGPKAVPNIAPSAAPSTRVSVEIGPQRLPRIIENFINKAHKKKKIKNKKAA